MTGKKKGRKSNNKKRLVVDLFKNQKKKTSSTEDFTVEQRLREDHIENETITNSIKLPVLQLPDMELTAQSSSMEDFTVERRHSQEDHSENETTTNAMKLSIPKSPSMVATDQSSSIEDFTVEQGLREDHIENETITNSIKLPVLQLPDMEMIAQSSSIEDFIVERRHSQENRSENETTTNAMKLSVPKSLSMVATAQSSSIEDFTVEQRSHKDRNENEATTNAMKLSVLKSPSMVATDQTSSITDITVEQRSHKDCNGNEAIANVATDQSSEENLNQNSQSKISNKGKTYKRRKSEVDTLYSQLPFIFGCAGRSNLSGTECEYVLKNSYLRKVHNSNDKSVKSQLHSSNGKSIKSKISLHPKPRLSEQKLGQVKRSTESFNFEIKPKSKKFKVGDLVIGDIKLFGWWYGKIVKHDKKVSAKHLVWVYWFGDHKILEFPRNYLESYKEFPSVFNQMKMRKNCYRKAVAEFIDEIQSLYLRLKLPLPNMSNISKKKEFSEWLKWANNGFVVTPPSPPSSIDMIGETFDMESPSEQTKKIAPSFGKITVKDRTNNEESSYNAESQFKDDMMVIHSEFDVLQELHTNNSNSPNPTLLRKPVVEKLDRTESSSSDKDDAESLNNVLTRAKEDMADHTGDVLQDQSTNKTNSSNLPSLENTNVEEPTSTNGVSCDRENTLENYKNLDNILTINTDKDSQNIVSASEENIEELNFNDKPTTLSTEDSQNDFPPNKENIGSRKSLDKTNASTRISNELQFNVDPNLAEVHSDSTMYYDIVEETYENVDSKHKKTRGGIELDINLIGTCPSKRVSSTKAEDAFRTKRRKVGKGAEKRASRTQAIDLPVETSRSKVLSWNIQQFVPSATKTLEIGNGDQTEIKINDLIIGKLKGFDWWFGKVISRKEAHKHKPPDGMCWVYWYGDHKLSQMPLNAIELLDKFPLRFLHKKMRGSYMTAVDEVLNEAAFRSNKKGLPDRFDGHDRLNVLVKWALGGFQPFGLAGLRCSESDEDVFCDIASTPTDVSLDGNRPRLNKDVKVLFDKVAVGLAHIEDLCLACGDTSVVIPHPLFEGGLCKECKESFLECAYLYDDNGSQMYCCICSDGDHIILCDNAGCSRSYCPVCIDMMCGVGYTEKISMQEENWQCFMCTGENVRLLRIRGDWQECMKEIFNEDQMQINFGPQFHYDPIPRDQQKPVRVLALFDGIATACFVLKKLNLEIGIYVASEIDTDAAKVSQVHHGETITYVGDVRKITKADIETWGPFDLVIGGSPCNDLSIANPARKGIYEGTGQLFFEFYRLLQYAMPTLIESRPFFWLFENVVGMRHADKEVISRFLQCNPVVVNAKDLSAQHRSRYFWGNLPGMNRPSCTLDSSSLVLQDCLEGNCGRVAKFDKVGCITTMRHSLRQTKKSFLPVEVKNSVDDHQSEDELWITEIERIFGFPEHYTDVGNMGQRQRQKLLGKSWSVPVIEHLLMPLKDYFKLNDSPPLTMNPLNDSPSFMMKPVLRDSQTQTSFDGIDIAEHTEQDFQATTLVHTHTTAIEEDT